MNKTETEMRKALEAAKANFDSIGSSALEGDCNPDAIAMVCAKMSGKIEKVLFTESSEPETSPNNGNSVLDDLKEKDVVIIRCSEFEVLSVNRLSYGSYQLILKPKRNEENKDGQRR